MISSHIVLNVKESLKNLSPAYFALVMATGIVSLALFLFGFPYAADVLLGITIFTYILLCVLYGLRIIFYTEYFKNDFIDHSKSPGFLTFVAATNVLGVQVLVMLQNFSAASWLLLIGIISWGILIYSFFILVIIKKEKLPFENAMSGIWLLIVVATQSVSVLATQVSAHFPLSAELTLFISLLFFLCGSMFYILLITLILYRLVFFTVNAGQFAPPYWINMGAVAITTLAGSLLILHKSSWVFLDSLLVFLEGFTLLFWAVGTWWIPLVFFLGVWKHAGNKIPFTYHPQYWGMVFPLGMYSVCTFRLSQAIHSIEFIKPMATVFLYISVIMWFFIFSAMLYSTAQLFTKQK